MAEQVKIMKLKVDLECHKCYKKVKKVLGKFPEIRDQVHDQKQNTVIITVVSGNPEKIRDKLCYKGGGSIKSIEIVEPPKPKPAPKPQPEPKPKPEAPAEKPKPQPPAAEPPRVTPPPLPPVHPTAMFPEPAPAWVMAYPPPVTAIPTMLYYEGHAGHGGYYGWPIYDSYGDGGRPAYMYRNDQFWREEGASWCTIV